jgi:hypothetical protein
VKKKSQPPDTATTSDPEDDAVEMPVPANTSSLNDILANPLVLSVVHGLQQQLQELSTAVKDLKGDLNKDVRNKPTNSSTVSTAINRAGQPSSGANGKQDGPDGTTGQ